MQDTLPTTTILTFQHYSQLEHINVAGKYDIEGKILVLLTWIRENGIKLMGLCRLHKHFDVESGECVVSQRTKDGIRTKVRTILPEYIPWQWKYDQKELTWIPIEFISVKDLPVEAIQTKIISASEALKVLENVFKDLDEVSCSQIGICINLRTLFDFPVIQNDEMFYESTNEEEREQFTRLVKKDGHDKIKEMTTRWFYDGEEVCYWTCSDAHTHVKK